jgi:putative adhesin
MRRPMNVRKFIALAGAVILTLPIAAASAQVEKTSESRWADQLTAGHWARINDRNGTITVGQASGDRIEVTAVKRWKRGNPDDVRIEAKKDGDDVVVCALWGDQTTCDDDHGNNRRNRRWSNDDNNDVAVAFTILLPRGVRLSANAVNGSVVVTGATSDAQLGVVNGDIRVESGSGPLSASVVNGGVHATITSLSGSSPITLTTVNGSVTAVLPSNVGADVTMTTVNGDLESDFPMTMQGRIDPHHLSLHVGAPGGPRITVTTVNGNIGLRKR